jgi:hypothetical protein
MGLLPCRAEVANATALTFVIRFEFLTAAGLIHWTWGRKLTTVWVSSGATDSKEET